ncbi:MAG TPA: hypothetical protein PLD10_17190, partial [Rhodopila sp.]|nr:hypothetical protein [Rhodopila sp.]
VFRGYNPRWAWAPHSGRGAADHGDRFTGMVASGEGCLPPVQELDAAILIPKWRLTLAGGDCCRMTSRFPSEPLSNARGHPARGLRKAAVIRWKATQKARQKARCNERHPPQV